MTSTTTDAEIRDDRSDTGALHPWFRSLLRCPADFAPLEDTDRGLECRACGVLYPLAHGRPVLIDDTSSLFTRQEFLDGREDAPGGERRSAKLRHLARSLLPPIAVNLKAEANYARLASLLEAATPDPRVLMVGAGDGGTGASPLAARASFRLLRTDVFVGPNVDLICDAHTLPFESGSFDAVVIQAVLEHLVDPARCVAEIHRVLRPGGIVFAESPFMQQVHMGAYDFTRFTLSGHRRLFRQFDRIDDGACCGPGMALAWAWRYFLCSFTRRPTSYRIAAALAQLTGFWLLWFDRILIDREAAQDAASGIYFLGRRSDSTVDDRDIIASYRGAIRR